MPRNEIYKFNMQLGEEMCRSLNRRVWIVAPSYVKVKEKFDITVVALDHRGEVDTSFCHGIQITSSDPGIKLPKPYSFSLGDKGIHLFHKEAQFDEEGFYLIEVEDLNGSLGPTAQPVKCIGARDRYRLFWGDIHFQTRLSDGHLDISDAYRQARDISKLDFACATDHDVVNAGKHPMGSKSWEHPAKTVDAGWEESRNVTNRFNSPNKFATLIGYEWTSEGGVPGQIYTHRNVYFKDSSAPIYPHTSQRSNTPEKLWACLEKNPGVGQVMTIAHHSMRPLGGAGSGTDWNYFDPRFERLVEVYSYWGSSEYFGNPLPVEQQRRAGSVREALSQAYRMGMICSSDAHTGRVGGNIFQGWLQSYPTGMVAVYAESLNRKAVWEALWNRSCYGTTGGKRIIIEFEMDGHFLGSEYQTSSPPTAKIKVAGTTRLREINLIKYDGRKYKIAYSKSPGIWKTEFEYCDRSFKGNSFYYVKVMQVDGTMGWAGPIWVDKA